MPVRNITSLMFGGDRLDELYVTSMARVKHPAVYDLFAEGIEAAASSPGAFQGDRARRARSAGAAVRRAEPAFSRRAVGEECAREPVLLQLAGRRQRQLVPRHERTRRGTL